MLHLLGDLATLAGGNMNYSCPSVSSSNCSLYDFQRVPPVVVSFLSCMCRSVLSQRCQGTSADLQSSFSIQFHSILSATPHCKFQAPWPPQTDSYLLQPTRSTSYVLFPPPSPHTATLVSASRSKLENPLQGSSFLFFFSQGSHSNAINTCCPMPPKPLLQRCYFAFCCLKLRAQIWSQSLQDG